MNDQHLEWPMLDFSTFPDNQISGLTLQEINEYIMASEIEINETIPSTSTTTRTIERPAENETISKRFNEVSDKEIEKAKAMSIPKGTQCRNTWAINLYEVWSASRVIGKDDNNDMILPRSRNDLQTTPVRDINYWLGKFIYEVRKKNGDYYPRDTLVCLTAGLNHNISQTRSINLFKDDEFQDFRSLLDMACRRSSSLGIGVVKKQAEIITQDEEDEMWEKGILGSDNSQTLIDTILYLNGLHFALRSGQEHRNLTTEQIRIIPPTSEEKNYIIEYVENISKTNQGGLKHRLLSPKVVRHIDTNSIENPERSHALLLKKYLSLRPHDAPNVLYLTPIKSSTKWYKKVPIGHNKLGETVKRLCKDANISGYKTNHSLRATCATRLFDEGVDEQLIMQRTGHRTTQGVRGYKRTSEQHHYNTSVIIDNKSLKEAQQSSTTCNFIFHDGCNVVINNYNN